MSKLSFFALSLCFALPAFAQGNSDDAENAAEAKKLRDSCIAECNSADLKERLDKLSDSGRRVEIVALKPIPLKKKEQLIVFSNGSEGCILRSESEKPIVVGKMRKFNFSSYKLDGEKFKVSFIPEVQFPEYLLECSYSNAPAEIFAKGFAAGGRLQLVLDRSDCESGCEVEIVKGAPRKRSKSMRHGDSIPSEVRGHQGEQTL